jgi:hypothetical protein
MAPGVSDLLAAADPASVRAVLAPDVAFRSPVADYAGRCTVAHLLTTIGRCLDRMEPGVHYAAGPRSASEFTAQVSGRRIDGVLVRQVDRDGLVVEVSLLLRPLAALHDAVERMRDALAHDPLPRPTGSHGP